MMFKRFKKGTNVKIYNANLELEGHLFAYGRIGAAKTTTIMGLAQGFKDNRNYKIFDLFFSA